MIELFLLRLTDRYHSDVNLQVRLGNDSSDSFDCIIAWSYAIVHVHVGDACTRAHGTASETRQWHFCDDRPRVGASFDIRRRFDPLIQARTREHLSWSPQQTQQSPSYFVSIDAF